jgi:hypothetical protein
MTNHEIIVRNVLVCFTLVQLMKLEAAFRAGKVIRGAYTGPNGSGCVINHLGNITSRKQLETEFPPPIYGAPRALINAWDAGILTESTIRKVLAEVIEERKLLNSAEDRCVEIVRRRIQARASMVTHPTVVA